MSYRSYDNHCDKKNIGWSIENRHEYSVDVIDILSVQEIHLYLQHLL